jgi:hypothetical protein
VGEKGLVYYENLSSRNARKIIPKFNCRISGLSLWASIPLTMDSPAGGLFSNYLATHGSNTPLGPDCSKSPVQNLRAVVEERLQQKNQKGWRRIVLNFTPS